MTMITPSYLGETIEYSSLHACRSTLEDPTATAAECSSRVTLHDPAYLYSAAVDRDPQANPNYYGLEVTDCLW